MPFPLFSVCFSATYYTCCTASFPYEIPLALQMRLRRPPFRGCLPYSCPRGLFSGRRAARRPGAADLSRYFHRTGTWTDRYTPVDNCFAVHDLTVAHRRLRFLPTYPYWYYSPAGSGPGSGVTGYGRTCFLCKSAHKIAICYPIIDGRTTSSAGSERKVVQHFVISCAFLHNFFVILIAGS